MSSMIVSTNPERRIREASVELAETVGAEPDWMCGVDCALTVKCRNAEGEPLCGQFCLALAAARSPSGLAQEVPVWLRDREGRLREFSATFQRMGKLPDGLVVAFFGQPAGYGSETEDVPSPAAGDWVPQPEHRPRQLRQPAPHWSRPPQLRPIDR